MAEAQINRSELVAALAGQLRSLALASNHIGHVFAAQNGLHLTDFRALSLIFEHEGAGTPLTARALARAMDLSPGAVTYSVDRLAESGHVWRDTDDADGRRVVLRFAPHGRDVALEFFGPLGQVHGAALAAYTDDELGVCLRILDDVMSALTQFGRHPDPE